MTKKKAMHLQGFTRSEDFFANIASPEAARLLAAAGGDIALIIDESGLVRDVAFHDAELKAYDLDGWIDTAWEETVTTESVAKIRELLQESGDGRITRARQVNHPREGGPDLPVKYRVVPIEGARDRLALGEDLRPMSRMQERLVQAQLDLEKDYRRYREAAERYRTVFKMIDRPILVADGETGRILDANAAATVKLGMKGNEIAGMAAARLFAPESRAAFEAAAASAYHGGKSVEQELTLAGGGSELVKINPYRENGQNNMLIRLAYEGLPLRIVSESSRLDLLPEAIVITDAKGVVLEANSSFLDRAHLVSADRVIGRDLSNWVGMSGVDMQVLLSRVREEGRVRAFATVLLDEVGGASDISVSAAAQTGEKGDGRVSLVITDAAARDRAAMRGDLSDPDARQFSELVGRVPLKDLVRDAADVIEKLCIEAALRQTRNNRASAADLLGLSRQSLYVKLRRYGLEDFTADDA